MATPSQKFKEEIYPTDFTDDDKYMFDDLLVQSRLHHPHIAKNDEWILKLAIRAHIRQENNRNVILNDDEIKELKEQYKLKNTCFETNLDTEFYEQLIASQNTISSNIIDNNAVPITSNIII